MSQTCIDQVKHLTGKLHQLISSQEKCCKDLVFKHSEYLSLLFEIFKFGSENDQQICYNITDSLCHVVQTGKRCLQHLVDAGLMAVACQCLVLSAGFLSKGPTVLTEDLYETMCTLLCKVGVKDKRLVALARLSGALDTTIEILKAFPKQSKLLTSAMPLLKLYSSSNVNNNVLLKNGVMNIVIRTLSTCDQKKTTLLRHCFELLASLCKSKSGAKYAVEHDLMAVLIKLYQEWHHADQKNRYISLRKAILSNIKVCTNYGFGKKALFSVNGYKILYFLALENLEVKEMESLYRELIIILRKCATVTKLPVKQKVNPLTFSLKNIELDNPSRDETSQEEGSDPGCLSSESSEAEDSPENNEDDTSKLIDDGIKLTRRTSSQIERSSTAQLTKTELERYLEFLPELSEFQVEIKGDEYDTDSDDGLEEVLIRIPTAASSFSDYETTLEKQLSRDDQDEEFSLKTLTSVEPTYQADDLSNEGNPNGEVNKNINLEISYNYLDSLETRAAVDFFIENNEEKQNKNDKLNPISEKKELSDDFLLQQRPDLLDKNLKHTVPFVIIPDPFIYGHEPPTEPEPLLEKENNVARHLIFQDFDRTIFPDKCINRDVYNIDVLMGRLPLRKKLSGSKSGVKKSKSLSKCSPVKSSFSTGTINSSYSQENLARVDSLLFESRFECGNLRKAIQLRLFEYDLILSSDVNTTRHHQWFFFQVSNMVAETPYRFNIINCEKPNSQFNFGMQPLLYSSKEARRGKPSWKRTGFNIAYYKNMYSRHSSNRNYFTLSFSVVFPYSSDQCYLAYHYPYSYTMLNKHLTEVSQEVSPTVYFKKQLLCKSLGDNNVPILTVTNFPEVPSEDILSRPYIFLTARVHPGESNASWVMKGVIDFLLSNDDEARHLRSQFIFKLVPMLNPDGVINGCHRCSLSGQDLNRQWKQPDQYLHPTIYHTKNIMKLMLQRKKKPILFVDFHGHSRKKNVFMFGCRNSSSVTNSFSSTKVTDSQIDIFVPTAVNNIKVFPQLLDSVSPYFSIQNCHYAVEKSKEGTARIVGFQELEVERSYTMESTYCGFDQGSKKGYQISTDDMQDMGKHFCQALLKLASSLPTHLTH